MQAMIDAEAGGAPVLRIAMWSGPRNISTAMLRSWGNRDDTCLPDPRPAPDFLADVLEECQRHYDHLAAHRLVF